MEAKLRTFYLRFNPENLDNIDEILKKYAGKERQLCARLQKKYGVSPLSMDQEQKNSQDVADKSKTLSNFEYDDNFKPYVSLDIQQDPLDFRSACFDPKLALESTNVKVPVNGVFPLDNLQKCRPLLPVTDPNYQLMRTSRPKTLAEETEENNNRSKKTSVPTLFQTLADTYEDGPFFVLRQCFLDRKRIVVMIRRVNSIRGTCTGLLKGFDKHMNLLLLDVTEVLIPYSKYRRMQLEGSDQSQCAETFRNRQKTHRLYHKQLFIRGDNIVMIYRESHNHSSKSNRTVVDT